MSTPVELFCTFDEDSQEWLVWFPHPLGGMHVLESFTDELEARKFRQDQLDSADFGDEE